MANAKILHVGDDVQLRIPVMQWAGLTVLRCECSIAPIRDTLTRKEAIDAIVFQTEGDMFAPAILTTVRFLSKAPLVLFQHALTVFERDTFDLIIPPITPPVVWLQELADEIKASRRLQTLSRELCKQASAVCSHSQRTREMAARNCMSPINPDALWRGGSVERSGSLQPQRSIEAHARPGVIKDH
jgi:hypothetical protein